MSAVNMGSFINSDQLDYCPFIDYSRGNFYFTSEKMVPVANRIENAGELDALANGVLNGMGNRYGLTALCRIYAISDNALDIRVAYRVLIQEKVKYIIMIYFMSNLDAPVLLL